MMAEPHTLYVELSDDNPHGLDQPSISVIRKRLSDDEVTPPDLRWNSDCDCVQRTNDGGTTWVDDPGSDPRHAPAFLKPARTGMDIRCNCAANMVKWLRDYLDATTLTLCEGATAASVATELLNFVDLIFPGGVIVGLILEIAATIFGIGCAALTVAFNDEQYNLLLCIFYCGIGDDGRCSADQLAAIESKISLRLNTTAALIVNLLLGAQGEVGLSNAGAIGTATADCSGCDCGWCFTFFFVDGFNGFAPLVNEFGTYGTATASGIQSAFFAAPAFENVQAINMTRDFAGVEVTSVEVVIHDPDWNGTPALIYFNNDGTNFFLEDIPPGDSSHVYNGAVTLEALTIGTTQSNQGSTQYHYAFTLTLRGIGINPFGDDNC